MDSLILKANSDGKTNTVPSPSFLTPSTSECESSESLSSESSGSSTLVDPTISILNNITNFLGESPFYVPETETLFWVDILKGVINSWNILSEVIDTWDLKQRIGCAVPVRGCPEVVLVAAMKGIGLYDLNNRNWTHYYGNPEQGLINNRWNDGKCGPDGRFWVGSMNYIDTEAAISRGDRDGALYVLDGSANSPECRMRKDYIGISNGLAWSKNGLRMYYIDTPTQCVAKYAYDGLCDCKNRTTDATNREPHPKIHLLSSKCIIIPKEDGAPDGCAMDIDDNLWIAMWGGGSINQYSTETGEKLQTIPLIHEKFPTSLAWFGEDLERLFVTTAQGDSLATIIAQYEGQGSGTRGTKVARGQNYVIEFGETNIRGVPITPFNTGNWNDTSSE